MQDATIRFLEDKPKSVSKEASLELIKAEIDCGRPVIALGVVGPPEACIVTGYRDNGEKLLGWSLFQHGSGFGGNFEIDESGYFIKDNWWENTEAVMSIGENIGALTPVKKILENALWLMTEENIATYGAGTSNFYGGQAAYEAWAKAVENDETFSKSDISFTCYSQGDAEKMLGEGRYFASLYIKSLAEQYSDLSAEFMKCAGFLKSASDCAAQMQETWDGKVVNEETIAKFRAKETRTQIAQFIRKAAQYEKDACEILKNIIEKI